jgi:sugar phosphate permease
MKKDEHRQSTAVVWTVIILHTLNHVMSGSLPMFYPDLMDEFNLSYARLGIVRSAAGFAAGFPQMFVGVFRRWTSGRVIVGVGNLVNAITNILISISNGFTQFLGFTVIGAIGSSAQHPLGASIITSASDESNRGRMLGFNQSIPSLAFSFTPLIAAYLLTRMGWRTALGILSIPALICSILLIFIIQGTGTSEQRSRDALSFRKLNEAFQNRNVISISALRSVMAFRMGVRTFLPLYFIDVLGFSPENSSFLYSIMLFGGVIGPVFWGNLSDRMNRKPLIIGIMLASAIGYFLLNFITNYWLLAALLFIIGFLVQTVIVQSVLFDSVEKTQIDQMFGFYYTIGFTIASFSSVIFGYIIEIYGFNVGFVYIAAVTLLSLLPALFIQDPRKS